MNPQLQAIKDLITKQPVTTTAAATAAAVAIAAKVPAMALYKEALLEFGLMCSAVVHLFSRDAGTPK